MRQGDVLEALGLVPLERDRPQIGRTTIPRSEATPSPDDPDPVRPCAEAEDAERVPLIRCVHTTRRSHLVTIDTYRERTRQTALDPELILPRANHGKRSGE